MKPSIRNLVPLFYAALLASCASAPRLSHEQILEQYPQIATLEEALTAAATRNVDNLAPEGFKSAQTDLSDALAAAGQLRQDAAISAATQGLTTLKQADNDAETSANMLRDVLDMRARANEAGASTFYPKRSADLDNDLRKTAGMVERGKREELTQRRPRLLAGYSQLELAALKKTTTDEARAQLARAKDNNAPKLAPKTYRLAEDELALALTVLDADRTHLDKANAHARRAKWLAEQASAITELVEDFDHHGYSREDIVLWHQKQLTDINIPFGEKLPFNEPGRRVVLGMQQSIEKLLQQCDDAAIARRLPPQEISLTAAERVAINKVLSLYGPDEANVYQQRKNVLISAHGFRFPPGDAELESRNFPLLNKVLEAIRLFPESRITISGHTDTTGSTDTNQVLSERRAANVARFLTEVGGVARERITSDGFGEQRPIASNLTPAGRAENRRVEVLIVNQ